MQSVNIICVGKLKETFWRAAFEEYAKRLGAYCSFSVTELDEGRLPLNPEESEIAKALAKEECCILNAIKPRSYVIVLCIEGKQLSSIKLASKIEKIAVDGYSNISFVIGSSFGLSEAVKRRADLQLSFSKLTFPHQMARVILSEQIYRAYTIINNTKYHK